MPGAVGMDAVFGEAGVGDRAEEARAIAAGFLCQVGEGFAEFAGRLREAKRSPVRMFCAVTEAMRLPAIKLADIKKRETQKVSSLPEGLANTMSPEEFLDLIEFLSPRK